MAEPIASRARMHLFGEFAYTDGRGRDLPISSRRGRAVLAYLALQRDQRVARARLAGLLWTDRADAQARASLRQCLVELRNALGDSPLEVSRENVALRPGHVGVDAQELQGALDGGDLAEACRALGRIGAERLLNDPAVSDVHQEWIDQTRAQVERRIAAGVHALLDVDGEPDWALVRDLADAFLCRHPLDEPAVSAAMRADAALGCAASAILRYAALKAGLQREFGVSPGEAAQDALRAATAPRRADAGGVVKDADAPLAASPPVVVVAAFHADRPDGLAQAVREEIISGLSRFHELSVIDDRRPVGKVRQEPWLRRDDAYSLTGGLYGAEQAERLVCTLARTGDGGLVWSDRAHVGGAGPAVDGLVARVVAAVLPSIHADLAPRLGSGARGVHARHLLARNASTRPDGFEEAQAAASALQRLIADEPGFSPAHLSLARLYNTDFGFTRAASTDAALRERAFDLTKTALALDRGHVHAYTVMGWCYLWRRQWEVARRHFDQAVELNPYNVERLMEVGFGSLFLGDLARARTLLERCLLLHPVPQDGFYMDLGLLELLEGRHELAASHFAMIAKPSLCDALYDAINSALAGSPSRVKSRAARARIKAIWPHAQPDPKAVAAWFVDHHPFRSEPLSDKLAEGLHEVLATADC